jgi:hypothetical protein
VLLLLSVHCSEPQQRALARDLAEVLGPQLAPPFTAGAPLPSPTDLRRRFVVACRPQYDPAAVVHDLAVPDLMTDDDSDDEFNGASITASGMGHDAAVAPADGGRLRPIAPELRALLHFGVKGGTVLAHPPAAGAAPAALLSLSKVGMEQIPPVDAGTGLLVWTRDVSSRTRAD